MGRHSDALLARAVLALAPKYSQKSRAVSERAAMNFATPPPPQGFSPYVSTICSAQVMRHLCEDALAIALAGRGRKFNPLPHGPMGLPVPEPAG